MQSEQIARVIDGHTRNEFAKAHMIGRPDHVNAVIRKQAVAVDREKA